MPLLQTPSTVRTFYFNTPHPYCDHLLATCALALAYTFDPFSIPSPHIVYFALGTLISNLFVLCGVISSKTIRTGKGGKRTRKELGVFNYLYQTYSNVYYLAPTTAIYSTHCVCVCVCVRVGVYGYENPIFTYLIHMYMCVCVYTYREIVCTDSCITLYTAMCTIYIAIYMHRHTLYVCVHHSL